MLFVRRTSHEGRHLLFLFVILVGLLSPPCHKDKLDTTFRGRHSTKKRLRAVLIFRSQSTRLYGVFAMAADRHHHQMRTGAAEGFCGFSWLVYT